MFFNSPLLRFFVCLFLPPPRGISATKSLLSKAVQKKKTTPK